MVFGAKPYEGSSRTHTHTVNSAVCRTYSRKTRARHAPSNTFSHSRTLSLSVPSTSCHPEMSRSSVNITGKKLALLLHFIDEMRKTTRTRVSRLTAP